MGSSTHLYHGSELYGAMICILGSRHLSFSAIQSSPLSLLPPTSTSSVSHHSSQTDPLWPGTGAVNGPQFF